jgi:hypothetical protein
METLIGASKILTILSGFLIFFANSPVKLTQPEIKIENEEIIVNSYLLHGFSRELQELILSGTEVTIKFKIILKYGNKIIRYKEVNHTVSYDLVTKRYTVIYQEEGKKFETKDQMIMKNKMSRLKINLLPINMITPDKQYSLRITAELLPINVKALKGGRFLLSALWDYKKPKTECKIVYVRTIGDIRIE